MGEAWLYAVVTAAVAAVVTAAVWRPRPEQWVLLLGGPLLTAAAAAGSVSGRLVLTVLLVLAYAYLLVAAALPWERAWARWAVPGTVVAGCLALGASAVASLSVLVVLAAPFVIAVLGLLRALAGARAGDQGRGEVHHPERVGLKDAPSPRPALKTRRLIRAVAELQGIAGLAVLGLGAYLLILERRHPTTGTWAGFGDLIALIIAGLGVMIAATFFGIAAGLRRRYRDFRLVFVVMQGVVAASLVMTGVNEWTGPAIAWVLGTAALAVAGSGASADRGAQGSTY